VAEIEGRERYLGAGEEVGVTTEERSSFCLSLPVGFCCCMALLFFGLIFFNTYWYIILFARGMAFFFFLFLCSKRYIWSRHTVITFFIRSLTYITAHLRPTVVRSERANNNKKCIPSHIFRYRMYVLYEPYSFAHRLSGGKKIGQEREERREKTKT